MVRDGEAEEAGEAGEAGEAEETEEIGEVIQNLKFGADVREASIC